MSALVLPPLCTTRVVDEALLTAGFVRAADFPFGDGVREIHYLRGEGRALVLVGAQEGAAVLQLDHVEPPLVEALARALEAEDPPALIAAVRDAADARAAVRAIGRLSVLFYLQDLAAFDEALDLVLARLTDPHPIVRWTACNAAPSASRKVEAALAAAKERYPELTGPWEGVRDVCQRMEDGTLGDTPTGDVGELARRAAEGAAKQQWKRVEQAAEAWLAEAADSADAAYYRAIAHRGRGEPLLALAWMAGAAHGLRVSAEVDRKLLADDPENAAHVDPEAKEAALAQWEEELRAIRAEVSALPDAERKARALLDLFERWASTSKARGGGALGAAAVALEGIVPEIDPLLAWLRVSTGIGASDADRDRVLREAAGSPWVWRERARHLAERDPEASTRAWEEALRLVSTGAPKGPLAVQIERLQEAAGESLAEVDVLAALMNAAYERHAWDEAAARADTLSARDPGSVAAWQIRANARTFGLRHEEAAPAYDDAIREITRLAGAEGKAYIGDPRPAMEFNRACVLAKLGRREEALEGLRRAVEGDEKWAESAAKDDYFAALWSDPDLLAIVRGDPAARLLADERTPAHALALLEQANRAIAGLDAARAAALARQALVIARAIDVPILRVSAGILAGYVTVVKGDVDGGLALARDARAELDTIMDADPRWRAEQLGEYVTALSAAQRWDEAEAACREALAARAAAFGEASLPVVLSYNQLALIEIGRGAPATARAETLDRAAALLDRVLAASPEDAEAHAQRAWPALRRADLAADPAARVGLLASATEALETAARLSGLRLSHVDPLLLAVEQAEAAADLRPRLADLYERLIALLFPDPSERAERLFWRRMRHDVGALRGLGHDDRSIAAALTDLLRGAAPELVRDRGVFHGFAEHLARHTAGYEALAVMAPMALHAATTTGDVLGALEQLEGLILAARGAAASA